MTNVATVLLYSSSLVVVSNRIVFRICLGLALIVSLRRAPGIWPSLAAFSHSRYWSKIYIIVCMLGALTAVLPRNSACTPRNLESSCYKRMAAMVDCRSVDDRGGVSRPVRILVRCQGYFVRTAGGSANYANNQRMSPLQHHRACVFDIQPVCVLDAVGRVGLLSAAGSQRRQSAVHAGNKFNRWTSSTFMSW